MENTANEGHSFRNDRTSFELPLKVLCRWLKMMKEKTGNRDIEHALRTIKFMPLSDDEQDIVSTVRQLYIAEMNGDLTPPPSMRDIYENIDDYCARFQI